MATAILFQMSSFRRLADFAAAGLWEPDVSFSGIVTSLFQFSIQTPAQPPVFWRVRSEVEPVHSSQPGKPRIQAFLQFNSLFFE
ncbi:hypothetical protein, partial [Faecalibaculum rodentium]|uniref:hypothetical protein n=1 Tax=Faecalibaculum rodentium TaxID=1702221 RepID=UPI00263043F3